MNVYLLVDPTLVPNLAVVSVHRTVSDAESAAEVYAEKHAPIECRMGYRLAYAVERVRERMLILTRSVPGDSPPWNVVEDWHGKARSGGNRSVL